VSLDHHGNSSIRERRAVSQTSAQTHVQTHPCIKGFQDGIIQPGTLINYGISEYLGTDFGTGLCPNGGSLGHSAITHSLLGPLRLLHVWLSLSHAGHMIGSTQLHGGLTHPGLPIRKASLLPR
jgi:hypothetical protein